MSPLHSKESISVVLSFLSRFPDTISLSICSPGFAVSAACPFKSHAETGVTDDPTPIANPKYQPRKSKKKKKKPAQEAGSIQQQSMKKSEKANIQDIESQDMREKPGQKGLRHLSLTIGDPGIFQFLRRVWECKTNRLAPNLARVLPSTCITFLVYENTRYYLQ